MNEESKSPTPKRSDHPRSYRWSTETIDRLAELAERTGLPQTLVIQQAIRLYYDQEIGRQTKSEKKRKKVVDG